MTISLKSVSRKMSSDWNRRARSAPRYYVAMGKPEESWQDFVSGGQDLVCAFEKELGRLPSPNNGEGWRALEIGCGPGRLMFPLSQRFSEIHGVDVSTEMVRLARANLASVPHAHVHAADGTSLPQFSDEFLDFVYSYAVFQHIPSRDVVLNYLKESRRVLKTGGVARMQFNGLAEGDAKHDTWSGVRFTAGEIAEFAKAHDLQLLALEGVHTQYMWATFLKRSAGWYTSVQKADGDAGQVTIRRVANADGSATIVPAHGPYASFALWAEGLPSSADLNTLRVYVGDGEARLTYVGPRQPDGIQQVSGMLPPGLTASIHPVRLMWSKGDGGKMQLGGEGFLRLVPPGPEVPRIVSVTDGMYVASGRTISTQTIRVSLDARRPEDLRVTLDGKPAQRISHVCTIPDIPRFEICFQLPPGAAGSGQLEFRLGSRNLGAVEIVIVPERFWGGSGLRSSWLYRALGRFVRR